MGVDEHKQQAAGSGPFRAGVLTVSDSRTEADDQSGALIKELVGAAGHAVAHYAIVKNLPEVVRAEVSGLLGRDAVDFVIITGGTGIGPRDLSIEAVRPLLAKELDGFGDIFRYLSFAEIGSAAIMSRATAGSVGRGLVFCLPGSLAAVRLAVTRLILPEIAHLLSQLRKRV